MNTLFIYEALVTRDSLIGCNDGFVFSSFLSRRSQEALVGSKEEWY